MKFVFIVSALLILTTLGISAMFWSVHIGTGEDIARKRAVSSFRWSVVIMLATFNIWIFVRVGGAIKDIWFPPPPPPVPVLIDGQLPGRPAPD